MKFLCVCYYDAAAYAGLTAADFRKMGAICAPRDEEFKASGKVRLVGSLAMPDEFRTLRADASGVSVTDGPYDATPEPFGAFFIIEAEDMDEAARVARLHPGTHLGNLIKGGIELRPIRTLEAL
jgi:hypothetical protein